MSTRKSIAITGAGGFVAKNLRRALCSEYDLTSFSQKSFKPLEHETAIVTDYESSLASHLKCCDVLIHLIGVGKQNIHSRYTDVNTKITSDLVQACKNTSVSKIIYLSGLGVSPKNTSSYFISKFHAEQSIIHSGINYTIFRPSFIIGKNDHLTQSLNSQVQNNNIIIPGHGKYIMQPIHISDAVHIIRDSILQKKFSNKIIDLVGPEKLYFVNYVKQFSAQTGTKISKVPLTESIKNALTSPNYTYSLDDLNILLGGFVGDFERLDKIYDGDIRPIRFL